MPGITVVDGAAGNDALDDALESVRFGADYDSRIVYDGDGTATDESERATTELERATDGTDVTVAYTGYPGYPVAVFDVEDCTLVLEGHLYDTDDVAGCLADVPTWLRDDRTDRLSTWVAARDGDFLLVVVDRTDGTTWVVNDAFGRLPTYRATVGGTTVLTRELKLVRRLASDLDGGLEPDPLALAQMLLFRYPLGTRTLYDGVEQLPPGSLLELGSGEPRSLHEFRFDRHEHADRDVETNARLLRDRFVEACENRARVADETVVSLSGGLDSRAVLAGYSHVDTRLTGATSARRDGGNAAEVDVARQVARALDVPWSSYVADRTDRHEALLLDATQGMNGLGMSIGLDFAEQVAGTHDNPVFVTGDGGDKALPDLTPSRSLESIDELLGSIIFGNQVFSLDDVTAIVGVDEEALLGSIRERVASYPESSLEGKYVHFQVRERAMNWLNHGEDRTRYYLWSTTPFYALPFFTEAMACPPDQKRGTRLYREFLSLLSPAAVEVDYVDFGAPITSLEYRLKRYGYDFLEDRPDLERYVSRIFRRNGSRPDPRPARAIAERTSPLSDWERYLSRAEVQRITWAQGTYANKHRYLLFTLVAALEHGPGVVDSTAAGIDTTHTTNRTHHGEQPVESYPRTHR